MLHVGRCFVPMTRCGGGAWPAFIHFGKWRMSVARPIMGVREMHQYVGGVDGADDDALSTYPDEEEIARTEAIEALQYERMRKLQRTKKRRVVGDEEDTEESLMEMAKIWKEDREDWDNDMRERERRVLMASINPDERMLKNLGIPPELAQEELVPAAKKWIPDDVRAKVLADDSGDKGDSFSQYDGAGVLAEAMKAKEEEAAAESFGILPQHVKKEKRKFQYIPLDPTKCPGCGVTVQSEDPLAAGYRPAKGKSSNKKMRLCRRCYSLRHYGEEEPLWRRDAKEVEYCGPRTPVALQFDVEQFMRKEIKERQCVVVLVIDLLDYNPDTMLNNLRDLVGKNPVVVVGNKIDLLPRDANLQRIKRQFQEEVEEYTYDDELCSA